MKLEARKRICLYEIIKGKGNLLYEIKKRKGNQFNRIEPIRMKLRMRKRISLMKLKMRKRKSIFIKDSFIDWGNGPTYRWLKLKSNLYYNLKLVSADKINFKIIKRFSFS